MTSARIVSLARQPLLDDGNGRGFSSRRATAQFAEEHPGALFWSVTVYDPVTGSGLDNGQLFPSINITDKPPVNSDGSTDVYFGPNSPGEGKNWLRTLPAQGFFVIVSIYGPTQALFDKTWKPSDIQKTN